MPHFIVMTSERKSLSYVLVLNILSYKESIQSSVEMYKLLTVKYLKFIVYVCIFYKDE